MRRGVRSVTLRHLNRSGTFPSGNARWYYRPKGRKGVAMPDPPVEHPKFLAAYVAASGETPRLPARAGSITKAITEYKRLKPWKSLADSTKAKRLRLLDHMLERGGSALMIDLQGKHIQST